MKICCTKVHDKTKNRTKFGPGLILLTGVKIVVVAGGENPGAVRTKTGSLFTVTCSRPK
jgi:hypothetical protein